MLQVRKMPKTAPQKKSRILLVRFFESAALALCLPISALAQTDSVPASSMSALEWWAVVGSLAIGALISMSRQPRPREQAQSGTRQEMSTDHSNTDQQRELTFWTAILMYAIAGAIAGILASVSTQFPVICTFGTVSILLLLVSSQLLGVFRINLSSIFGTGRSERLSRDWPSGAAVSLMLAFGVAWAVNSVFGIALADTALPLIAGIAAGLVIGALAGRLLWNRRIMTGRIGDHRHLIRPIAGIAMIALSIFVAGNIPEFPELFFWAVFLIVLSVFCGATTRFAQPPDGQRHLLKGAGIVMLIFGVIGLASASFGYRNLNEPFTEFSAFVASGGEFDAVRPGSSKSELFAYARTMEELDRMQANAQQAGKPVVVDFYADWCLDCKRMDRTTFKDPSIAAQMTDTFDSIKIDISDPNDEFGRALRKRFSVFGPPALLFFDRNGNISANSPVYGYLDVDELTALLAQVE